MNRNIHTALGGRDIAGVVRSFSGSHPATLSLNEEDLLGELRSMGYDPGKELALLITSLRKEERLRQRSQQFTPVINALNTLENMGKIVAWSIMIRYDERLELSLQTPNILEAKDLIPLLSTLITYTPVILPEEYGKRSIILSGEKFPKPSTAIYDLYTSLVYLDSRNRKDYTNTVYTSAWVPTDELVEL